jgi:outer membrane receptor protein involved in Fe transport
MHDGGGRRAALTEYMIVGRVDGNLSDKQKVFVRVSDDQCDQTNFISVVSPLLNVQSKQPIWNGQINHTYIFSPNVTNQFIASAFYYSWPFGPANLQQTLAASPAQFNNGCDGGTNFSVGLGQEGRVGFDWGSNPTSTASTQYQFVDDLSWLKGNHNLKFGFNFKRYDVTDGYPTVNTYAGYYSFNSLGDLAGGVLPGSSNSNFNQTFDQVKAISLAGYNYGIYAQDEWKATPRLVLDYGVRIDRNGNILCNTNCFFAISATFPRPTSLWTPPIVKRSPRDTATSFPRWNWRSFSRASELTGTQEATGNRFSAAELASSRTHFPARWSKTSI